MKRACLLVALALSAGCPQKVQQKAEPPAPPAGKDVADPGDKPPARAVYAAGKASPIVKELCTTLRALPLNKTASCCGRAPGLTLVSECERLVGGAVAAGNLKVNEPVARACIAAMRSRFETCDNVGVAGQRLPPACDGLLTGGRQAGEPCRSGLECPRGMACAGVGPTKVGICQAPGKPGDTCGRSVDPLGAYLPLRAEDGHPECEGFCAGGQCQSFVAEGKPCRSNVNCGPSAHCAEEGVCRAGAAGVLGGACLGGKCAEGLRCAQGTCVQPKPHGEACAHNHECRGRCDPKTKRCAMICSLAEIGSR